MGKTLQGSDKVMKALQDIAKRMGGGSVEVGIMENATYPDGTPVAAAAFWNEYGTSTIPARPFFRNMIAAESPTWPDKMARGAVATNYNGEQVLAIMGADIQGALKQSINNMTTPPNAARTIKAKKGASKPLVDTGHLLNSIEFKVKK